jgi:hypothetical protein
LSGQPEETSRERINEVGARVKVLKAELSNKIKARSNLSSGILVTKLKEGLVSEGLPRK